MAAPPGGAFLVGETDAAQVFTPEELSDEARLMARTMEDFVEREVAPMRDRLEAGFPGLMRSRLQKAGRLGLMAGGFPLEFGGLALFRTALTLLAEKSGVDLSFAISLSVHAGVGALPLLLFGTEAQKRKYLPGLASGETIAAFALSEGNSGSDALAARSLAAPAADGYTLNGVKLWVTNGAFADLLTVFAHLDGAGFTAFLVERNTPGVCVGPEERKMGLRGSSTCRVMFSDVRVPAENLLGAPGKGHLPALYALNMGRFNIAAIALGAAKDSLQTAAQYARQRRQFGKSIAEFGLIQHKLAEMATRIFLLESMVYRTAGSWDAFAASETEPRSAYEEYAIECAILKFFGTEVLAYAVDECLQIHGGFGFSEDYTPARAYRDARVFRLFEGTSEINRLAVMDQLRRRVQRGRLTLPTAGGKAPHGVAQTRNVLLSTLKALWETPADPGDERQEASAAVADMAAVLFALESACQRAGKWQSDTVLAVTELYEEAACAQVNLLARTALGSLSHDVGVFRSLPERPLLDTVRLRRQIAHAVLECGGYPW